MSRDKKCETCGEPLLYMGEYNGICPNWKEHRQGNPEFTQCIGCKSNLLYKPLDDWMGNTNQDLPYCPNADCVRYGLFTLEADELVTDLRLDSPETKEEL